MQRQSWSRSATWESQQRGECECGSAEWKHASVTFQKKTGSVECDGCCRLTVSKHTVEWHPKPLPAPTRRVLKAAGTLLRTPPPPKKKQDAWVRGVSLQWMLCWRKCEYRCKNVAEAFVISSRGDKIQKYLFVGFFDNFSHLQINTMLILIFWNEELQIHYNLKVTAGSNMP